MRNNNYVQLILAISITLACAPFTKGWCSYLNRRKSHTLKIGQNTTCPKGLVYQPFRATCTPCPNPLVYNDETGNCSAPCYLIFQSYNRVNGQRIAMSCFAWINLIFISGVLILYTIGVPARWLSFPGNLMLSMLLVSIPVRIPSSRFHISVLSMMHIYSSINLDSWWVRVMSCTTGFVNIHTRLMMRAQFGQGLKVDFSFSGHLYRKSEYTWFQQPAGIS